MDKIPSWQTYFMNIAQAVSLRSKDSSTKVGSVIVDEDRHIIGTGFNGFPPGVLETPERWERPEKYLWVCHSEANAILHAIKSCKNATLYTTMYPCENCAKLIISAGIKEVIYYSDKYKTAVAEAMFSETGVKSTQVV